MQFCGGALAQRYGLQFRKLVAHIEQRYVPQAPPDARSAVVRLELVTDAFKRGQNVPSSLVEDQPKQLDDAWTAVRSLFPVR